MKTIGDPRPSLAPAWLLVAVAIFLFLHPLACRGTQPLVWVPDDGPLYFDSGPDSGPDAGDAGDGGYHADGGCEIGGTVFPIGIWQNLALGSCTVCDPEVNPNGWTGFDAGEPQCRGFGRLTYFGGGLTVPFAGVCSYDRPFGTCGGEIAGNSCDSDQGCAGGFCNAQHWCEVNQNIAWFTACGGGSGGGECLRHRPMLLRRWLCQRDSRWRWLVLWAGRWRGAHLLARGQRLRDGCKLLPRPGLHHVGRSHSRRCRRVRDLRRDGGPEDGGP